MPGPPSAQVLPRSVNPRKFAYQDTRLAGNIEAGKLERLQAAVVKIHDNASADLHFYIDDSGKAVVEGRASVAVTMTCQRCLEAVRETIAADIRLALVQNEEQSRGLHKVFDPWLVDSEDGSANLHVMVEDELLLALPMVALHRDMCIDENLLHSKVPESEIEGPEKTDNPFEVLKQLQGQNKTSRSD